MKTNLAKVAVVQATPGNDSQQTIDCLGKLCTQAASQGAQLAVFPEAFVGGYPKGKDFGVKIGMRSSEGRTEFSRYFENAIDVPGPATESIGEIARQSQLWIVVGVVEREGGTLYCTALFFGPDGKLLGKHRKLMPTAMERVIWGFGDGSTLPAIPTPIGKLGAVICWENYMPLLRTAMYAKGVQLYCALTVDDRDSWLHTIRHIALEGRCFVLSACQFLPNAETPISAAASTTSDKPISGLATGDKTGIRGGSCIVSPFGEFLAGPIYGAETILIAEIDLSEITRSKFDLDVTGHYARPDVFQLIVNDQPQSAVVRQR